jgi:hypothetical protein
MYQIFFYCVQITIATMEAVYPHLQKIFSHSWLCVDQNTPAILTMLSRPFLC